MFILVNHCQDTGLMELDRYDTREEAAKDIALIIAEDYQIDVVMLRDAQQFLEECNDHDLTLEDYGQETVAFDSNYGLYRWIIKPTNIH